MIILKTEKVNNMEHIEVKDYYGSNTPLTIPLHPKVTCITGINCSVLHNIVDYATTLKLYDKKIFTVHDNDTDILMGYDKFFPDTLSVLNKLNIIFSLDEMYNKYFNRLIYILEGIQYDYKTAFIELPEMGLCEEYLSELLDVVKKQSENKQIVLITYSEMVAACGNAIVTIKDNVIYRKYGFDKDNTL